MESFVLVIFFIFKVSKALAFNFKVLSMDNLTACGAKVFTEFMAPLSANMMGASSVGEGKQEGSGLDKMLKMLGSFTVLRLTSLLGAGHVEVTKEQLLDLNDKLNQIAQ